MILLNCFHRGVYYYVRQYAFPNLPMVVFASNYENDVMRRCIRIMPSTDVEATLSNVSKLCFFQAECSFPGSLLASAPEECHAPPWLFKKAILRKPSTQSFQGRFWASWSFKAWTNDCSLFGYFSEGDLCTRDIYAQGFAPRLPIEPLSYRMLTRSLKPTSYI